MIMENNTIPNDQTSVISGLYSSPLIISGEA